MSNQSIETWITNLNHEDKKIRKEAVLALSYTGQPAIDPLVKALAAGQISEEVLADIMGRIGNEALDDLAHYLGKGDVALRRQIAHVLGVMADARTIEALIDALEDTEDVVRAEVAASLGSFSDPRAARPLMDHLDDANVLVRARAAESLRSYHRDPAVLPTLMLAATDSAHEVRNGVARALAYFQDERAVALLNKFTEDSDSEVRQTAAASLQHQAGDRMVFDRSNNGITGLVNYSIGEILADDSIDEADMSKMRDSNPRVRARLLEYVATQSGIEGVKLVLPGLKDINPAVRQAAIEALARLASAKVEIMEEVLLDSSAYVRAGAIDALGIVQPDNLVELVAPMVKDESDMVRRQAILTLANFSERAGAIDAIREADRDSDRAIRDLATETLAKLGYSTSNPLKRFFKRFSN